MFFRAEELSTARPIFVCLGPLWAKNIEHIAPTYFSSFRPMLDLKVGNDLMVRDEDNNIVQFIYGDLGMSTTKIEKQRLSLSILNFF